MKNTNNRKTTVGVVSTEVLAFTAGKDVELDLVLAEADCLGSAAHVTMLSRMPVKPVLFSATECQQVVQALAEIASLARSGKFQIRLEDQDVHLAVERTLTQKLGELGKRIHTGRSRNDQVALDLRLYAREQILGAMEEAEELALVLLAFARRHRGVPMVGRTHMQPGMPSSVGLWASSFTEELTDGLQLLRTAYAINNRSPLGSAASYGVPLPINRKLVADLLAFDGPCHNVLYANNARGRVESIILGALSQVMLTLSRLAQDLMLFTMPEFAYFVLPAEYCTGSSIMPQKKNPDVLELVRAKTSRVAAAAEGVYALLKGLPTGYNRDLQEAKEPFMEGLATTRASLRISPPAEGMHLLGTQIGLTEFRIRPDSPLAEKRLGELHLRHQHGVSVIGQWHGGAFTTTQGPDTLLRAGAILIVVGPLANLEQVERMAMPIRRTGPIVVAGYGAVGFKVAQMLKDVGENCTVIDIRLAAGVDVVGNVLEFATLKQARVREASAIILALSDDSEALFATASVRDYAPEVPLIVRVSRTHNTERMYRSGADFAISEGEVAGKILAYHLLDEQLVPVENGIRITRLGVGNLAGRHPWRAEVRERSGANIIAIERGGEALMEFASDFQISLDDALLVCGTIQDLERFQHEFETAPLAAAHA